MAPLSSNTQIKISDRAFEERASHYNISRHPADNPEGENGWRYLTTENDIAEWEGI